MTRLDYEALSYKGRVSDNCGDDLPRTGSYADQQRQMKNRPFHGTHKSKAARDGTRRSTSVDSTNMNWVVGQLNAYVAHARHADFLRKSPTQQSEVLRAIRMFKQKIEPAWARNHLQCDSLVRQAEQLLIRGEARRSGRR